MKKKLLCLFLCTIMLLSLALTSCSVNSGTEETVEGEDELTETDRTPVTLTLWLPSEKEISEETRSLVEAAMNEYLKATYTTAVELKIYTKEAYAQAVEDRISKIEEKAKQDAESESIQRELDKYNRLHGITTEATTATESITTEVETFKNEWGVTEQRYPAVGEYQMDIFLITDYTDYIDLIERDALHELDTNLDSTSKSLKSYIYPTFLSAAKFNGSTYAIPNNHGVDDFKFLLLNKELVDKYSYSPTVLADSVATAGTTMPLEEYIEAVVKYEDLNTVDPILSWIEPAGMSYWSEDGEWSVVASTLNTANSTYDAKGSIGSIFKNNTYKSNFKWMKSLEENGYFAEDPATCEKFAVGVVEGGYSDVAKYEEDYYISVYEYPVATQKSVFAGAFAVSAYTEDLDRAMEVILCLNTVPELRNILQYGVEDVHYKVTDTDEDGNVISIERLNDDYVMDILHTGNSYIAYFDENMTGNEWEDAKKANLQSSVSPFIYCTGLKNSENAAYFADLKKLSADLYTRMMAVSYEDVDTFFSDAHTEIASSDAFTKLTDSEWENSLVFIYNAFYEEYFAVEEEEIPAE